MEDLRPQQWHVLCAWAASHAYIVEIAVLLQLLQLRVGDMEFQRELTGWHQLHIVCGEVCDHDSNAMQCIIIIMILYCPKLNDRPSCIPSITIIKQTFAVRQEKCRSVQCQCQWPDDWLGELGIRNSNDRDAAGTQIVWMLAFIGDHCMFC